MKRVKVSNNVIRRLPRYLRKLDELTENGISRVSSFELGSQLGLTPSQIRQDFSCFGEFGQQGYGYNVPALRSEIASILGMDRGFNAIMIGVGNIGRALTENFNFSEWGFRLIAAFDVRPEIIGTMFHDVPILSMDVLAQYLSENRVDVAVLAVPKEAAIPVTQLLTGLDALLSRALDGNPQTGRDRMRVRLEMSQLKFDALCRASGDLLLVCKEYLGQEEPVRTAAMPAFLEALRQHISNVENAMN